MLNYVSGPNQTVPITISNIHSVYYVNILNIFNIRDVYLGCYEFTDSNKIIHNELSIISGFVGHIQ